MIVEAHDEGTIQFRKDINVGQWYDVGHVIGEIDDGDEDGDEVDWLWQAYSHEEDSVGEQ
jgi:pyruvate/2-oxoglutarate dehydrogenase complex dihydrolipoamide acyltransferase (E2) component